MDSEELELRIRETWSGYADLTRIEAQLERRGVDPAAPALDDLAMIDQLHSGQLRATRDFAAWVAPAAGTRVLDLGAGLGGAARCLAAEHGCTVTALELSPELHATGAELTRRTGLAARVRHCCADLRAPAPEAPYDLVWLQHVDMHVPDKEVLYIAVRAALAPGGRAVWHDWLAGPGGAPRYPVPWSRDGSLSFLQPEADFRAALSAAGLETTRLAPQVERTRGWFAATRERLTRVLDKPDARDREHLGGLLAGVTGVLDNLDEARLVPVFGQAEIT